MAIPNRPNGIAAPLLLLAWLMLMLWLADRGQQPPPVDGDPVAQGEFSLQRARQHVATIAGESHPTGSAANARVRDHLLAELRALGGEVEIQRRLQTYDYARRGGDARFAMIENVIAHWPGREDGPALLLMSHYDSTIHGPGAGDAASGVATILETLRALRESGMPLRNRLIVLLTDAEEIGLFGAQAFFGHHRFAADVGLVLNFDARGSRGAVAMFETSERNGALIDALQQAAPAPLANSLVYSVYRQMPNDTDLSIAKAAGTPGMNFAFVDGLFDYHRPTDTPDNLSPDTLAHLGSLALPLARQFGEAVLPPAAMPDRHYFNPLGHWLLVYPPWIDIAAWLLAVVLLGVATRRALRSRAFTLRGLADGVLRAVLLAVLPVLLVMALQRLLADVAPVIEILARQRHWLFGWMLLGTGASLWLHGHGQRAVRGRQAAVPALALAALLLVADLGLALLIAGLVVTGVWWWRSRRALPLEAGVTGASWLWVLLALGLLLALPGASHVLVWPLLALSLLQLWRWRRGSASPATPGWLLAGIPGALLLGACVLTFDLLVGFAAPAISVLPLTLLLAVFGVLLARPSSRPLGLVLAAAGLVCIGALAFTEPWTERRPLGVELLVVDDVDADRQSWASSDRALDAWHRQRLDAAEHVDAAPYIPETPQPVWMQPIERAVATARPQLRTMSSEIDGDRRRHRLHLDVDGDSTWVGLFVPADSGLLGWSVDGQPLQLPPLDGRRGWSLRGFALPDDGVELTLEFAADTDPAELLLSSYSTRLPDGLTVPPRPADRMRRPFSLSDGVLAWRRVELPAGAAPE